MIWLEIAGAYLAGVVTVAVATVAVFTWKLRSVSRRPGYISTAGGAAPPASIPMQRR